MFGTKDLTKEDFQKRAVAFIRKRFPGAAVSENADFSIAVTLVGKGKHRLFLDNLYAKALEGGNWERQLAGLLSDQQDVKQLPWEAAKKKLFPQIRNRKFLAAANSLVPTDQQLAAVPLVEDLVICWVIDAPDTMHYVNLANAKSWNRQPHDLLALSLENLAHQSENVRFKTKDMGNGAAMLYWDTGDGYDTSRLLLFSNRKVYDSMAKLLGENFVAGIPTRDMLVLVPRREAPKIREFVETAFRTVQRSISPHLFVIKRTGPELWTGT